MSEVLVSEAPHQQPTPVKPHTPMAFTNAKLILPDQIAAGSLAVENGNIHDLSSGSVSNALDCEGDYLLPGLVELHTDHLENHYKPRPGVIWNAVSAVQAHDAQIACSGITTVFDALRVGTEANAELTAKDMRAMADAIEIGQQEGRLRADHYIHLRCEVSADNCIEGFELFKDDPRVRLASLMDHTPGQRQFTSMTEYKLFYKTKRGYSDEQLQKYTARMQARADRNSNKNRRAISQAARAAGMILASHDDATLAHVEEAIQFGIHVAEFPTTLEAARASHEAGMAVLMGAPNVVRGKSHSGNISALALAEAGYLDVLSSDYVPVSLLQAAFVLAQQVDSLTLPEALQKVTKIPAEAVGLCDRGALEVGRRADLVQVRMVGDVPIVRGVWRQGNRIA